MKHLLIFLALFALMERSNATEVWPMRTVTIEEMTMVSQLRIAVPKVRTKGAVVGPALVRAHVDAAGKVVRAELLETCGSPEHDEAALRGLREARFEPKLVEGRPVPVTLLLPMHLPLSRQ